MSKQPKPPVVKKTCSPKKQADKRTKQENLIAKFKNIEFSKMDSELMLTVQNLEFPDANVKRTNLHKRNECGFAVETKKLAVDRSSSSNTHFRESIQTVKLRKQPCTTSTTTSASASRSASTRNSAQRSGVLNSQEMIDSQHKHSVRHLNLHGDEWKRPPSGSFHAGGLRPRIGNCPIKYEELAKMSKTRQKFFLTQDPRRTSCLVNPAVLRRKSVSKEKEFVMVRNMVKEADNLCVDSESATSASHVCEVIDLENPLGLDFQGMDYKNTYERDEQDIQNQKAYWRLLRYMDRKHTKAETKDAVEKELQQERLAIPQCFTTTIKDTIPESSTESSTPRLGKLYRSQEKPYNKIRIEDEKERRRQRFKNIYLLNKDREMMRAEERKEAETVAAEIKAQTVAQNDFHHATDQIDDAILRSFHLKDDVKPIKHKLRTFPKTLKETQHFKRKMLKKNCENRDRARIAQDFYLERRGQIKSYPDAELDIDCEGAGANDGDSPSPSEQSSDDEDDLQVGKFGDNFLLRGFHFKLGDVLRGKLHRNEIMQGKRTVKGCVTREEWLKDLVPPKEVIKPDIEYGIKKVLHPDDPNFILFPPEPVFYSHAKPKRSAVREYIDKRLGLHYYRDKTKNIHIMRPHLKYQVKKFNLIRYVFPTTAQELLSREEDNIDNKTTLAYIDDRQQKIREAEFAKKLERMKLLGLPCEEHKTANEEVECKDVESETDLDWVPEQEPEYLGDYHEVQKHQLILGSLDDVPLGMRGNMPAPKFRDKTLSLHPRKPRNYKAERIPSDLFPEAVETMNIPIIEKIERNKIDFANVHKKKRPYTDFLEIRHHHDHWHPTQHKQVRVHYQMEVVYPKITEVKHKKKQDIQHIQKAKPPCAENIDKNLTRPEYPFEEMIEQHFAATRTDSKANYKEHVQDLCKSYEFFFHSRDPVEYATKNYAGHQAYKDFLIAKREELYADKVDDTGEERLHVDKGAVIEQLEKDLESIDGCLTSLSSSTCTNLSKDSGSFLLIEGKTKLPLDYIRKPLVPFEELERSRFHAKLINTDAEEANPFRLLPFAGQLKEQIELIGDRDNFFTFNTRLRNSLRLRLEVPVKDVRTTLIGRGKKKYYGAVITDIDENYIEELKTRPIVKTFNFKTGIELLKDAMRLKFESLLIQGQIVRNKIYDTLNEHHWEHMLKTKELYERLFAKWEKNEYEAAMAIVYQVKSYYEKTDLLKREHRELKRELMMLNMDIVFIEGHWIRCIMLQNFHYLLGDQEWRMKNDWIHLKRKERRSSNDVQSLISEDEGEEEEATEYELESFDESIAKRSIVNIRKRDKDDAWAIRQYYYDVYMQNVHPILQPFPDADCFLKGIENLKNKTFVLLLEMHFTLSIHTELQGRLETFMDWCAKDLKEKEEYVARKSAKKIFMEARAEEMMKRTLEYLDKPIEETFNDDEFNKHRAVIAELWRRVVPQTVRGSSDVIPNASDMVAMISDVVMEILTKFEHMDINKVREIEAQLRSRRRYLQKISTQAYQIERRIETEMKNVRRNLEPTVMKVRRPGKLQRLFIKKKKVVPHVEEQPISENTKNFMRAFHDVDEEVPLKARESLMIVDTMQEQIVPFYFDHFLKLNGYTPNYNFKTQIELRDGPEIDRFQVREVIPDVIEKLNHWEYMRKKTMEENIQRNPKMYENVM